MPKPILIAMMLILATAANAASLGARFEEANGLLQSGDTDGAIALYRDLLVDHPNSETLRYAMASAEHRAGRNSAAQGARETAQSLFDTAKTSFDELTDAEASDIRREATFASADTLVQKALLNEYEDSAGTGTAPQTITTANAAMPVGGPDNYKQAVDGWKAAVQALESVVREYPDMERARRNLDAARYRLKKLLQDPPEDQQEEEQQPQDQPPPPQQVVVYMQDASTEYQGLDAQANEAGDIVRLVPKTGGAQ